jgi:hypothetical protein
LLASGDQSGYSSVAGLLVRLTWLVPSAFMVQTSMLPLRSVWKAILVPSGDQELKPSFEGLLASLTTFAPFGSIV